LYLSSQWNVKFLIAFNAYVIQYCLASISRELVEAGLVWMLEFVFEITRSREDAFLGSALSTVVLKVVDTL
jgi:hypothetical protein